MPFKSLAQRRFMWAAHPDIAKEFEEATPKGKTLPEKVKKAQDASQFMPSSTPLPADIHYAGGPEKLEAQRRANMQSRGELMKDPSLAPTPPKPGPVQALQQTDKNIPKTVEATQIKAASVLASLLYLNKLK
jgi:hypothetical protein